MYTDNLSVAKRTIVGVQFLFVAFGAIVLVPLLIGINPATALFTAGLGTFLFHIITKGKVPIFLGSSFAFIAPIMAATEQWGLPGTLAGLTSVSLVYFASGGWPCHNIDRSVFVWQRCEYGKGLLGIGFCVSVNSSRCIDIL